MYSHSSTASPLANVFKAGIYNTRLLKLEPSWNTNPPPKQLLIATPQEDGEFAVLLLLHGFFLCNSFYSQLIERVASHGFIVIAPQLYTWPIANTSDEIRSTAAITNWLSQGLTNFLPPNTKPNFSKLALAGHSRGGKTAFALARRKLNTTTNLKFSALIGVDPVDGMDSGKQTTPPVLTYVPHSFDFDMAALVIGSGLGEVKRYPWFPLPPGAPKGINHEDFFNECGKPSWYFVAKDYGHFDMLDDDTNGIQGMFTYWLCKNGESRRPMRTFVGGAIVAFLKAYLHGDNTDLLALRERNDNVPLELKTIQCYV